MGLVDLVIWLISIRKAKSGRTKTEYFSTFSGLFKARSVKLVQADEE